MAVTFDTHVAQVDFSAFRPAAALAAIDTPDARAPDARPAAPQVAGELQACHDTYTVVRGDTLSTIASRTYRDGSRPRYMAIFSANQDRLREPDLVVVGEELRIPCP
ncbi:MAG: LysM peptidoglycan-binding domain-containing protein [Paracoccaceae bacterium]|nr:LysM peptidoglycan-binding domain-containing protein [Paracoccaceae bacterium]